MILALANFYLGRLAQDWREQPARARRVLELGIALNLLPLLFYKLVAGYGTGWLEGVLPGGLVQWITQNPFPLGLSYLAFQMISYQVDIHNELVDSEQSFLNFALYVFFFPKIVAGPITRYRDLSSQLVDRPQDLNLAASGARRLVLGLAKKVLIADTLARVVNPAFAWPSPNLGMGMAWLALVGYALQLYFDFSGFTDMAIGMGQMFGFRFVENFNYPYISRSISEFWRRWHISLSGWFREYVFYPLEFTRKRADRWRQALHILVVFLLTGLWHGLTANFILWGLLHGLASALELAGWGRALKKLWVPLQHGYTLAVLLLGWVFFRSPGLGFALGYLRCLFGLQGEIGPLPVIDGAFWAALAAGIIFSLPVHPFLQKIWKPLRDSRPGAAWAGRVGSALLLLALLAGSAVWMVSNPYEANIYGSF